MLPLSGISPLKSRFYQIRATNESSSGDKSLRNRMETSTQENNTELQTFGYFPPKLLINFDFDHGLEAFQDQRTLVRFFKHMLYGWF